jgi:trk system potassium uptake protein TrkA
MNILILGAGEFGRNLAATFCNDRHDVTIIDRNAKLVKRVRDKLDIMTLNGEGGSVENLKRAGVRDADLFIAVSSDDATNVLSCQVAKHFGVAKTICRLSSMQGFSEKDQLTPEMFGVDYTVIPEHECVHKICSVLDYGTTLEKIRFTTEDAMVVGIRVMASSPVTGTRIKDFSEFDLAGNIKFCAILRNNHLIIPDEGTVIVAGDEVYIAGGSDAIEEALHRINPDDHSIRRVVIADCTEIGRRLAHELADRDYEVRIIERQSGRGEEILNEMRKGVMVIVGDPNDADVLEEAGIGFCDAFVSAVDDDEDNILSCILAKRHGAKKVIAITNKSEYISIVPTMTAIDCSFSTRLVASNAVLRNPISGTLGVYAILHRIYAYLLEFKVVADSPCKDRKVSECKCPPFTVLAMLFREGDVVVATGNTVIREGDTVVALAMPETARHLESLFVRKGRG